VKYKKPVCDCGGTLFVFRQDVYTVEHSITADGKESKKRRTFSNAGTEYFDRLNCDDCDNQYEIKYDNSGRIIRGALL
jgi:hypothetical protein